MHFLVGIFSSIEMHVSKKCATTFYQLYNFLLRRRWRFTKTPFLLFIHKIFDIRNFLSFAIRCDLFLEQKKNFSIFCVCIFINVHYQYAGRSLIVVKIICNQSASINYHVFFTNDHSDWPTALMITLKFVFARI